ncbi:MAG: RcpC/CpaB family pilus assembly protein, partial [Myxococcota bacterium]|nr:RcpC/CpaB family pilus assembly protein [Myxococcota bacterium]
TARDPEVSAEDQQRARKSESRRRKTLVTVEVTSEEAEKLALGSSRGELHLVLRGDLDVETTSDGEPVVANDLVGKKPRTYRQRSSGPSAVVISGDSTTVEQFSNGQRIIRSSSGRR